MFSKKSEIHRVKPGTAPAAVATPRTRGSTRPASGTPAAGASTTMIESNFTAINQGTFSHKPGSIPAYLRNKTCSKNIIVVQVKSNKKQFIQIKKELTELQKKAIEYYKRYRESVTKLNKLNGNDDPLDIEELQIVVFTEKSNENPIVSSTKLKLGQNISISKLKQITEEKVFSDISQQMHNIQVHSFKLIQEFSDRLSLIKNQMKLAENSAGGDSNVFPANFQNFFEELEKQILEEKEQQNKRIMDFMSNLKHVMINEEDKTNEIRKSHGTKVDALEFKLTNPMTNEKTRFEELNAALIESQSKRDDQNKEIEKLVLKLKMGEMLNSRLEKQLDEKFIEVSVKCKSIKSMQEKVSKYWNQIQKLESNVARTDEEHKAEIYRLKTKYEEEAKSCKELRIQINNINLGMVHESRAVQEENIKLKSNAKIMMQEIISLKLSLNGLLHASSTNKRSKTEENVLRREMERRDDELNQLKANIFEMKEELVKSELKVAQKTEEVCELENRIKQLEKGDCQLNDFQEEIRRLHKSNERKSKKIKQLQIDLSTTVTAVRLQEESLFMQQRLLKIRSELIQSLQENESSTKSQIADLIAEVESMTFAVKQVNLNNEMTSVEELEDPCCALDKENVDIERQDHIITMLEQTHERNQIIRVKLEEKIGRLENENADLKRFIVELNVPFNSSTNESSDETSARPYSSFYQNLKRKKRQGETLIKVRKYNN